LTLKGPIMEMNIADHNNSASVIAP
jgi:hypothetical protein